ncbi:MAG: hypothetical protein JWP75_293 [Frondihabitans sp.]|nr:hypothetical protein [Frondihabitans sp.]
MCRLFGMHTGARPTTAEFWLVDAPDSLEAQSHANRDGFGIGTFGPDGSPDVEKAPLAAWQDPEFAATAHTLRGTTFVAHVRHATNGGMLAANTHPFLLDGRLFAHNGVVGDLGLLESHLAERDGSSLVQGDTDSERVFALITAETRKASGDLGAGIQAALAWIVANLEVVSVNFVLITPTDLWAFRYPEADTLFVLDRGAGGARAGGPGSGGLDASGSHLAARAPELSERPAVVVASERLDDDPGWRAFEPGELVHVDQGLRIVSSRPLG